MNNLDTMHITRPKKNKRSMKSLIAQVQTHSLNVQGVKPVSLSPPPWEDEYEGGSIYEE